MRIILVTNPLHVCYKILEVKLLILKGCYNVTSVTWFLRNFQENIFKISTPRTLLKIEFFYLKNNFLK